MDAGDRHQQLESSGYAHQVFAHLGDELDRAESKAAILLAGLGVVVGVLLTSIVERDYRINFGAVELVSALAVILLLSAVACFGLAIYPRLYGSKRITPDKSYYFGDFASADGPGAKIALLPSSAVEDVEALSDSIAQISRILVRKYEYIRVGMVCTLGSLVFSILAVLTAHICGFVAS